MVEPVLLIGFVILQPESNVITGKINELRWMNAPIGEQGGDPASIDFCYRIGLDYVSCSPFRIPIARLSSAQVTVNNGTVDPKYGKKLNA